MKYYYAKDYCVEVVCPDGLYEATFNWKDELDSGKDFEIPLIGIGCNEKEAIGDLVIRMHEQHLIDQQDSNYQDA